MSGVDKRSGTRSGVFEPTARMAKALRLGMLESTREWLRDAIADDPTASVTDLLDRAIEAAAEAKRELAHYDNLDPDQHRLPSRNIG